MLDLPGLKKHLRGSQLHDWPDAITPLVNARMSAQNHGDFEKWKAAIDSLPKMDDGTVDLNAREITVSASTGNAQQPQLERLLGELHPWRKGPFSLHGVDIDSEWRSDLKWDRLVGVLDDLTGKRVLDIGCGNGYHCWRMAGAGAELAVGIDPTLLYVMQFLAVRRYIQEPPVWVLPLSTEDLSPELTGFDSVFSMGVMYHRRSPIDHLIHCRDLLVPGGQLILETLVIQGDEHQVLVPEGRYARMRNVWFLPSPDALKSWLIRCGFQQVEIVDVTPTSSEEQRSTGWMTFESLEKGLAPGHSTRTVEGHPAPLRCIVSARL